MITIVNLFVLNLPLDQHQSVYGCEAGRSYSGVWYTSVPLAEPGLFPGWLNFYIF